MRRGAGLAILAIAAVAGCASPPASPSTGPLQSAAPADPPDPLAGIEIRPGHPYRDGTELDASVHLSEGIDEAEAEAILAEVADLLVTSTGEAYASLRIDITERPPETYAVGISGRLPNGTWSDDLRLQGPLGGLADVPGDPESRFLAVPDAVIPWLARFAGQDPRVADVLPIFTDPVSVEWFPDAPGTYRVNFGAGGCDVIDAEPAARVCTTLMHVTVDAVRGTVLLVELEVVPV